MSTKKPRGPRVHLDHSFGPYYDKSSRILILGSFPSVKSREMNFYYGHPQNRFWKIMAALYKESAPESLEEKKNFLTRNHIAVYDVIESCSIIGSADSTIEDVRVTDLTPILAGSQIGSRIFVNGGKACALYQKYQLPVTHIEAAKLPSSSPANAAYSLDRLIHLWGEALGTKGDGSAGVALRQGP